MINRYVKNFAFEEFNKADENGKVIESVINDTMNDFNKARERAEKELDISANNVEDLWKKLYRKKYHLVEGVYFEGVFCDILGTLFSREGRLNKELFNLLNDYSGLYPVNLWTGDIKGIWKFNLLENGIIFPVLSKQFFRGSKVKIAYDDMLQENFLKEYEIEAEEYKQVNF